jgi:hypothetical protein
VVVAAAAAAPGGGGCCLGREDRNAILRSRQGNGGSGACAARKAGTADGSRSRPLPLLNAEPLPFS